MSILSELNDILSGLQIPIETGIFSGVPPDEYIVLTPLADKFTLFGDNKPQMEVCDVRVSLFSKGNYLRRARQIASAFLSAGFVVTDRRYIGREDDTGYHHYVVDVAKEYGMEES